MKTSMQFLKEEIQNKLIPPSKENGELSEYQYSHNVAYGTVLTIIEYLLEKEKEQIQKAFSDGQETPINHPTLPHYSRDEYYNDNYKPETI